MVKNLPANAGDGSLTPDPIFRIPLGDFPGGAVVKTAPSKARGAGLTPGQGAKILHA